MQRTLKLAAIIAALIFAPLVLRADTISQGFTEFIGFNVGTEPLYPLAGFNPADGTLTGITFDVTGGTGWIATIPDDWFTVSLLGTNLGQSFFEASPGFYLININFSGTVTTASYLADFIVGNTYVEVIGYGLGAADMFAPYSTVNGTITYDYTPSVPEPGTFVLLAFGTALLGCRLLKPRPA